MSEARMVDVKKLKSYLKLRKRIIEDYKFKLKYLYILYPQFKPKRFKSVDALVNSISFNKFKKKWKQREKSK